MFDSGIVITECAYLLHLYVVAAIGIHLQIRKYAGAYQANLPQTKFRVQAGSKPLPKLTPAQYWTADTFTALAFAALFASGKYGAELFHAGNKN